MLNSGSSAADTSNKWNNSCEGKTSAHTNARARTHTHGRGYTETDIGYSEDTASRGDNDVCVHVYGFTTLNTPQKRILYGFWRVVFSMPDAVRCGVHTRRSGVRRSAVQQWTVAVDCGSGLQQSTAAVHCRSDWGPPNVSDCACWRLPSAAQFLPGVSIKPTGKGHHGGGWLACAYRVRAACKWPSMMTLRTASFSVLSSCPKL